MDHWSRKALDWGSHHQVLICRSFTAGCSVEETEDLATDVLLTGLFVVHDADVRGQDDESELTGWQNVVAELLEVLELEVEAGGDNTALVEAAVEVDDDLAGAGIIDDLEVTNVSVLLHAAEESDEDLGDWSQDNLSARIN